MAIINCRECGKEISDKAYACPHCGYPIKDHVQKTYSLRMGQITESSFAKFLKICAYICWILGIIVAITGSNVTTYGMKSSFSIITFLTILVPYVIYGVLFKCMSTVVYQTNATYDMICGLHLDAGTGSSSGGMSSNNMRSRASGNSGMKSHLRNDDQNDGWRCAKCGALNSLDNDHCRSCGQRK